MRNETNRKIAPMEGKPLIRWVLELGLEIGKKLGDGDVSVTIPPGEKRRATFEPGLLAYERNTVLGVTDVSLKGGHQSSKVIDVDEGDDEAIQIGVGPHDFVSKALYTFTIWGESNYEAVHEQPKRLQRMVIWLAALTVLLAAFQVAFLVSGV